MSHAPLLYGPAMVNWFTAMNAAKSVRRRGRRWRRSSRLDYLAPVIAILQRPHRPDREALDGLDRRDRRQALRHHAHDDGRVRGGVAPARGLRAGQRPACARSSRCTAPDGTVYAADDGVRRDSSVEKLAKLKPVFDRTYGNVTAGNSSQVTDGAAMLILASEDVVNEYGLKPLGRIVDTHWGALDPSRDGPGPGARDHAAADAPRAHLGRHRRGRDQRGVRRPGAGLPRGVGRPRLLQGAFRRSTARSASWTAPS